MVVALVVIVAIAVPGTATAVGLSVQIGVSVVAIDAVIWQVKATVPVNPEPCAAASWIVVEDTPPGATADGFKAEGCSVNSDVPCPTAAVPSATTAANMQTVTRDACPKVILILDSVRLPFDMNRLCFNSFDSRDLKKAARASTQHSASDVVPVGSLIWLPQESASNSIVIQVTSCGARAARENVSRKKIFPQKDWPPSKRRPIVISESNRSIPTAWNMP